MFNKRINEIELLRACVNGNTSAFEAIVEKYQSFICAITFSATGDMEKSEELAQQTFINAWKNLAQLKDFNKFRSWLTTIARNVIKNFIRTQKRDLLQKAASLDQVPQERIQGGQQSHEAITEEQLMVVQQALIKIPERYREPLVLFYREQQSIKQVARQLDLSEQTTRQRLFRGRKMLKEEVASIVEKTIAQTGPGKTFTTAVIASVAGLALKTSGVAAAAGIATASSTTATTTGLTAIMSGVTAKIITAAAIVAIGAGALITYRHMTKPSKQGPDLPQARIIAREQRDEPDKIREQATGQPSDETANLLAIDETQSDLKTKDSGGLTTEITQKTDKNNPAASEANSIPVQSDDNLIVGGFVKSEDGQPIHDVDVQLLWDVKRGMPMLDSSSAVTDPNGRWQCQITGESEDIIIRLKHSGYLALFSGYRPSFDDLLAKSVVLIMKKGLQVSGFVHDTQGNPVSNVLIMPPRSITGTSAAYGIKDSAKTARTDANGIFLLNAIEPGFQDIAVDANGYAPTFVDIDITPEMSPIDITLDYGQDLTGVVVDINGQPLSGVKIKIDRWKIVPEEGSNNFSYKNFNMLRRQTITDAAGQYTIERLPSIGDVEISFVKRPHFLSSYIQNNMAQNKTKLITMYPIPTITGIVIDADSEKPITEFEIVAGCMWDPNSSGSWDLNTDKITSPQGNFSKTKSNFMAHESPSPGWAAVKINAKGYLPAQSQWMHIGRKFSPITIRLKKTQILSSTLFYSDGVAVSNADVILIEPSSWVQVTNGKRIEGFTNSKYSVIQTDPNGYFEFSAPSAPTKILVLEYYEYLVADTNDLKNKLTLTPWAYVTGLVDTDNGINSNITVKIAPEYDPNAQIRWWSQQTTNADGRFEFFYIPAIPQKTNYSSAGSSNTLNKGPNINPRSNQELKLQLGTTQPVDPNITSTEKTQSN